MFRFLSFLLFIFFNATLCAGQSSLRIGAPSYLELVEGIPLDFSAVAYDGDDADAYDWIISTGGRPECLSYSIDQNGSSSCTITMTSHPCSGEDVFFSIRVTNSSEQVMQ